MTHNTPRQIRRLLVPLLVFLGASTLMPPGLPGQDSSAAGWRGKRPELLQRVRLDQAIRDTFAAQLRSTGTITQPVARRMRAVDSSNTAWLKPLIRQLGWPTVAAVGRDGVEAAFLLVQHADQDTAFQASVLPRLNSAYTAGNIDGESLAMLTDRVAKAQGKPQRYGTQATIRNGTVIIDPIEDSAEVDARRARLGLPPLAAYKRTLDSVYSKQGP